jgi:Zn-dependent M28 family amino/carboxypeptidase
MLSLTALLVLAAAPIPAAPSDKFINADALKAHVGFLADDALEGRGPATRGDTLAQRYIAAQFQAMGLTPVPGMSAWYQPFDIVGISGHPDTLTANVKGATPVGFKFHDEFIAVSGHQGPSSKLDAAEVVFVGYGIIAPEFQWDDFKGMDLKGKVLLVMNNDPESDPALFAGKARLWYGRWDYKYEMAARRGAAGCIIIHTTPSAGYPWQVVQTSWTGEQFDLPAGDEPTLQVKAWMTEDATKKLVALVGKDLDALRTAAQSRDFKPVPLGVTVSTAFANTVKKKQTANVLALLPGSDPKLKDEWVVLTAHHDHLGKKADGKPGEDVIYNGAVDNASGVAAMLSVARAVTAMPVAPKRSVLFAAVAAEEQGLLGSQYLVQHPPVPTTRLAADINVDGANIWGKTRDVSVVGLGKSSLDGMIQALAAKQGRVVKPDELSDRGFFYRSDQFNFARAGVPSAYFASGNDYIGRPEGWGKQQREQWEAKHYHQPSDELTDAWDFSGAVDDARLYFQLVLEVANAKSMPTWNKGDEFESARLKAVSGAGSR